MEDEYFTIDEVAARFKVSRATIYKWLNAGHLDYVIVGGHRRITGEALRRFVRQGREAGQEGEPTPDNGQALCAA